MAKDNSGAQLGQALQQDRRRVRRKRNRSHPRTRPTPAQKELDRQAALEAAASLQQAASADEVSGVKVYMVLLGKMWKPSDVTVER
ncbi:hypothetical protein NDU88_005262 [Pleurodeles waltl]|uniref:Uncharacterized protein n=1 Tax=Pleurodeles waltl TaxID=8319 RepID=A0AAV7L4D1_PLEWA|nr:hypothetical protein NDU88_005262 [Pleurodeles waltl]